MIKDILLVVIYFLITIGDFFLSFFFSAKKIIGNIFSSKNTSYKKKRRGKKILPSSVQGNNSLQQAILFIKHLQISSQSHFSQFAASIQKLGKKNLSVFLKAYLWVCQRALFLAKYQIRADKHNQYSKRLNKDEHLKQRLNRARPLKPSFFYKFKFFLLGCVASSIFLFIPLVVLLFISDLPSPTTLSVNYIPKTTKILDRNGKLLYEIYANQNRTITKLSDIPQDLRNATIAIEDKDFYNHPGFDLRGIMRAFFSNLRKEGLQGGSTITQQLIKSAFLSPEPNIMRKIKEIALAFWAERIYTKDQILELYFNFVPYGGTAWGVSAASEVYFGKAVSDLDLAQASFLAGLPRAPSIYSPFSENGTLWKKRQKEVLDAMARLGYISEKDAARAWQEELSFKPAQVPLKAPHFVMFVRDWLTKQYGISGVERGGLQVKTSIDLSLQEQTERVVKDEVDADGYLNIQNGAALVTNPKTGEILAMVGSRDYWDQEHDGNVNVTTSLRQPGSTIKVVTYTLALSSGFTEATILDDSPLTISNEWETYTPVNYDGRFRGKIPLRFAFANSLNIPAVRVAQKLGANAIVKFGREMGIVSWNNLRRYGISITLGGREVTMLDLATVYGTVSNKGERKELNPILEVKDYYGKPLYTARSASKQVVDPGVAFIVTDILADNNARSMEFGFNSPLNIPGHRVSVKTGTTDNKRDNWTVGFTPDVVVATWVGNNDNSPMSQSLASGITGAAPMWNKIMTFMLKDKKDEVVTIPENIVRHFCGERNAYFIKGTENSASCNAFIANPSPTPTPSS